MALVIHDTLSANFTAVPNNLWYTLHQLINSQTGTYLCTGPDTKTGWDSLPSHTMAHELSVSARRREGPARRETELAKSLTGEGSGWRETLSKSEMECSSEGTPAAGKSKTDSTDTKKKHQQIPLV